MRTSVTILALMLIPPALSFEFYSPQNATAEFPVFIQLDEGNYEVMSYLYRGSKCYSGSREDNLGAYEGNGLIVQEINPAVTEEGMYRVMVKYRESGRKSWKTSSHEIFVSRHKENMPPPCYESTGERSRNLAPLAFMAGFGGIAIAVLFQKTI